MTLEERVQRLEDDRAIRDLKASYLRACDAKDPGALADCLLADAHIDFEGFPVFDSRDEFVAVYRQLGCVPGVFDIHHAANGVISFENPDRAAGQWALTFHSINLAGQTITQFGIEYDDRYVRRDGLWWIAETRSRKKSTLVQTVDADGLVRIVALGESEAAFGAS